MVHGFVNGRLFAIAVLAVAQLGITLHVSDHGPGEHEHDDAPCLIGAANEDDVFAPPPAAASPRISMDSAATLSAEPILVSSDTGGLLPPATGPPVSA